MSSIVRVCLNCCIFAVLLLLIVSSFSIRSAFALEPQTLTLVARSCSSIDADDPFDCGSALSGVEFEVRGDPRIYAEPTDDEGYTSVDVSGSTPGTLWILIRKTGGFPKAIACIAQGNLLDTRVANVDTAYTSYVVDVPDGANIECALSFVEVSSPGSSVDGESPVDEGIIELPNTGVSLIAPQQESDVMALIFALGCVALVFATWLRFSLLQKEVAQFVPPDDRLRTQD